MSKAGQRIHDGLVQMCRALAKGPIFKLRAGDFVHLWEGAFLRPPALAPGQPVLGSQALDFIQRELPLFDVPWSVKAAMDASGVSQKDCKEINPPILRFVYASHSWPNHHSSHDMILLDADILHLLNALIID